MTPGNVQPAVARQLLHVVAIFLPFACAGAVLISAPVALAGHQHGFASAFGSEGSGEGQFSNPVAAAVNDAGGDVYVVDKNNNRVERFSSTGAFISQFSGEEAPTGAFSGPDQVAVDNSGKTPLEDPSVGDVYVYDEGHQVIDKFDSTGKYLGQITEAEPGSSFSEGLFGIATDKEGRLWAYQKTGEIDEFDNAEGNGFLSKRSSPFGLARGFAVDAVDDLYPARGDQSIPKLNEAGEALIGRLVSEEGTAAAVDLSTNDVYIYNQTTAANTIAAFDEAPTCTALAPCEFAPQTSLLERFGAGRLAPGRGLAINSADKTVYAVASSANEVLIFNALVVPDVTTEAVANLTPTTATINGSVNPDGIALTDCHFEYGESESYGHSIPCLPNAGEIGSGNSPVAVHADLPPSALSDVVHYRLVAENANNVSPSSGVDQSFTIPGPRLNGASVTEVTSGSATFNAIIDPNSSPTSYFFQYGTSTEYGQTVPVPPAFLGEGSGSRQTEPQTVTNLTLGTTYHYRVVAISELSPGHSEQLPGVDQTFTTNGANGAVPLPDGRKWEMVSPPDKHGGLIEPIGEAGVIEAAADGDAVSYFTQGSLEDDPEGASNEAQVLSRRVSSDWASKDIATPSEGATGISVGQGLEYRFFSSDLSQSVVQPPAGNLSSAASEQAPYLRTDFLAGHVTEPCEPTISSCYRPLVTGCPAIGLCSAAVKEIANVPPGTVFGDNRTDGVCGPVASPHQLVCRPAFIAANPVLSHVILESTVDLLPGILGATGRDLYEWVGGELRRVGAIADNGDITFHAISTDGSRIVFDGESEAKSGLLLRDTAKEKTLKLDDAAAGCISCESGGGQFRLATPDASKVYFTSSHKLTSDAGAEPGHPDLYECHVTEAAAGPSCDLTDITPRGPEGAANAQGVLGASEDGSYLYYAAGPLNAPQVYVRHDGASTLIGVLSSFDASDWEVKSRHHTSRVSPNGQFLAFLSQEPLTGYDTHDAATGKPDMEVYLYDAVANKLVCASCDPSGARPVGVEYKKIEYGAGGLAGGNAIVTSTEQGIAAIIPGWTPVALQFSLYQSRYLSNSGRLFFNSHDALVPQDVNNTMDVYQYEPAGVPSGSPRACSSSDATFSSKSGGCTSLISAGTSPLESAFLDASESGADVFFLTSSRLQPGLDTDGERDVYDAHECSAEALCFSETPEGASTCVTGESCKPAPTPQPEIFGAPSSATFFGMGNPPPPAQAAAVKPNPPTRAQKYAKALAACKKKPKHKRKSCEASARRRYGTKAKARGKAGKSTKRKGR